jgi:SAM-dependent methyltransferase
MNLFEPKTYWETRLANTIGMQGVGYSSLGQRYNEWLYKVRRNIFVRETELLPLNWMEANVLDVGSGTGFYVQLWQEIGVLSITGSDLTDVSVAHLRQKFPGKEFLRLDIGAPIANLGGRTFNAISALDVLFHIVDDERYEAAIANIHAMLRPGGWFIFSDNLLHSSADRTIHQVSRSLEDVTSILTQVGFRIMRRRPMFVLMNYPVDTRSRTLKLLWRAFTFPAVKSELLGGLLGATVYPFESALTRLLREGPSTELMVCQKLP